MNFFLLPPPVRDLALAKCFSPAHLFRRSVASEAKLAPTSYVPPTLYPHKHPNAFGLPRAVSRSKREGSVLREKIQILDRIAAQTVEQVAIGPSLEKPQMEDSAEPLSEDVLNIIYQDLLASPTVQSVTELQAQPESSFEAAELVEAAATRLESLMDNETQTSSSSLSQILYQIRGEDAVEHQADPPEPSAPAYRRVLWHLQNFSDRLKHLNSFLPGAVPVTVLSLKEWQALIHTCVKQNEGVAAELCLDFMKLCRLPINEINDATDAVLSFYANAGDVEAFEQCLPRLVIGMPSEQQRHLHVKAHIRAHSPDEIPASALALLHEYESKNLPPPMKTYAKLMTTLLSIRSTIAQAQAWDLFTHMRYVAHPNPDVAMYTIMIRACSSPISASVRSEPERALDLWTEMIVDQELPPTDGSYNAIILACAKSGTRTYVNEAFRLAKEMLDSHRDAYGRPAFKPSRKTFCALLEGAKRLGDLERARWILAEMVRNARGGGDLHSVNEEVMMHVFHSYTSYSPPFKRSLVPLVDGAHPREELGSSEHHRRDVVHTEQSSMFGPLPPQSREEIIAEVKALFDQILVDSELKKSFNDLRFHDVEITPRLVNSYLSVYYRHSSLETSVQLFWSIFESLELERSPRSYAEAIQRCAFVSKHERAQALRFAQDIMKQWDEIEDESPARLVETVRANYIRVLTMAGEFDLAMNQVRQFVAKYPPASVRAPEMKPAFRASRISLVGARPLVRMTSVLEVPDDKVPPILTFNDLEILHHKLLADDRTNELGYLTYVCKAYAGKVRDRRQLSIG